MFHLTSEHNKVCWESSKAVENILGYEGTAGTEAEECQIDYAVKLFDKNVCRNYKYLSESKCKSAIIFLSEFNFFVQIKLFASIKNSWPI
jgi:hypothetical protein